MALNKKAESLVRVLQENLKLRGVANIEALDSQSFRISQSAVAADDEANILVRIEAMADDIERKDALGLAQRVYNPQVAKLMFEENSASPGDIVENAASKAAKDLLIFELSRAGLAIEMWREDSVAHAAAPVDNAAWASATKIDAISDLLHPKLGEV